MPWIPAFVLPNIRLHTAMEGGPISLVPQRDQRIVEIVEQHPRFLQYLGRFKDQFGRRLSPATIIIADDAPSSVWSIDAIASFRDAIAISIILYCRALEIQYPGQHRPTYSDLFRLYPWALDKNYDHLIARTPAQLSLDELENFNGQSSPEIATLNIETLHINSPLLDELLARWNSFYVKQRAGWRERALFRSLNMANQACLTPGGSDVTLYDLGRNIALWVSAFEILAHPKCGRSGLYQVYELLEKTSWVDRKLKRAIFRAHEIGKATAKRRMLAPWLYGELYKNRNAFLHGNPVTEGNLKARKSGEFLPRYAAPLFRMALTAFLDLRVKGRIPSPSNPKAFAAFVMENSRYNRYQYSIERTLLNARYPQSTRSRGRSPT